MTKKYKIHEAAKDFDIQSKDLIELVSKYFDGEKKYQTALEEKELDLVFDLLSKQNAPKSLDSYFARQKSAEDVKEKPQKSAAESKKTASKADAGKTKQNAKQTIRLRLRAKRKRRKKILQSRCSRAPRAKCATLIQEATQLTLTSTTSVMRTSLR